MHKTWGHCLLYICWFKESEQTWDSISKLGHYHTGNPWVTTAIGTKTDVAKWCGYKTQPHVSTHLAMAIPAALVLVITQGPHGLNGKRREFQIRSTEGCRDVMGEWKNATSELAEAQRALESIDQQEPQVSSGAPTPLSVGRWGCYRGWDPWDFSTFI